MEIATNGSATGIYCPWGEGEIFVVATARFRVLYVFVIMEVGTRKIAHFNVTDHPTAAWTIQQFREVITDEQPYRFVLHDRDSIYSTELDGALKSLGVIVLPTIIRGDHTPAWDREFLTLAKLSQPREIAIDTN